MWDGMNSSNFGNLDLNSFHGTISFPSFSSITNETNRAIEEDIESATNCLSLEQRIENKKLGK